MEEILKDIMINEEDLKKRIKELGQKISSDYKGKQVVMICTLKGAVLFFGDLCREMTIPLTMDFISVSSYQNKMQSTGVVRITKDLDESIEDKDVIIVEDIIDTGRTLHYLVDNLKSRRPKSIKICTLLDKPYHRATDIKTDYVGFEIEDEFVVGYGLDYMQLHRNLPYVWILKPEYYVE